MIVSTIYGENARAHVVCGGLHIINEINMVLKKATKHYVFRKYVRLCLNMSEIAVLD